MKFKDFYMLCEIMEMDKTTPPIYTIISDTDRESVLLLNNKHKTLLTLEYHRGRDRRGITFVFHDKDSTDNLKFKLRNLKNTGEIADYKAICDIFNVMYWHLKNMQFDPNFVAFIAAPDSTDIVIPKSDAWYAEVLKILGVDGVFQDLLEKLQSHSPLGIDQYDGLVAFLKANRNIGHGHYIVKSSSVEISSRRGDMYYKIIRKNIAGPITYSKSGRYHVFDFGGSFIE